MMLALQSFFQNFAQAAAERAINSAPEGLLIAVFAWALLRLLPRQNSRTRFAVWFFALLGVAAMPVFGGAIHRSLAVTLVERGRTAVTLPAHWAMVFIILWAAAFGVMMARLTVGLWRVRELRRSTTPVNVAELAACVREVFEEMNAARPSFTRSPFTRSSFISSWFARRVTLATSDRLRVPSAVGLWAPMIVLPAWALRELPAAELEIILRHEFAHLRHWDDWTNLVQKIVRAVLFFHPAVWWIEKHLAIEREMACDDVVVAETANPAGYASCIVSLLERSLAERGWTMAHALVHRAREASVRLKQILDEDRPAHINVSRPAVGIVGAAAVLAVVLMPSAPRMVAFRTAGANVPYSAVAAAAMPPALTSASTRSDLVPAAKFVTGSAGVVSAAVKLSLKQPGKQPRSAMELKHREQGSVSEMAAIVAANESDGGNQLARGSDRANRDESGLALMNAALLEDPFFVAASKTLFDEEEMAASRLGGNVQMGMPTMVFVSATEFVTSDAGSPRAVWRVQVLRVTFMESNGQRTVRVPIPHSI